MAGALYQFLYTDYKNSISGFVHVPLSLNSLGVKSNHKKRSKAGGCESNKANVTYRYSTLTNKEMC